MDENTQTLEINGKAPFDMRKRYRRFAFVWFNYTDSDLDHISKLSKDDVDYICYGHELCPSTNNPHLQCYAEFSKGISGLQLIKKMLPKGWNKGNCGIRCRNADKCRLANIRYCQKVETANPAYPVKFFELAFNIPKQGERNDLSVFHNIYEKAENGVDILEIAKDYPEEYIKWRNGIRSLVEDLSVAQNIEQGKELFKEWKPFTWQAKLIAELKQGPHPRKIIWYVDTVGNRGKSTMTDYAELFLDADWFNNGKTSDLAYLWDTKKNVAIFDLQRKTEEIVNYQFIESVKDGRIASHKYVPCRKRRWGGCHVVVFANWEPDYSAFSRDRYDVRHLKDEDCIPSSDPNLITTKLQVECDLNASLNAVLDPLKYDGLAHECDLNRILSPVIVVPSGQDSNNLLKEKNYNIQSINQNGEIEPENNIEVEEELVEQFYNLDKYWAEKKEAEEFCIQNCLHKRGLHVYNCKRNLYPGAYM